MDKRAAAAFIATQGARQIGEKERPRFIEVVETELSSLHEGNIARYRLRPSVFADWLSGWR
jgi:hypothetical protein